MTTGVNRQARILLDKAAEDEAVLLLDGVPDGPLGFHVQQAIEKLFKALLCQLNIEFRYTHDLRLLTTLLIAEGESIPDPTLDLASIGSFAVTHRYDDIPEFYVLDRPAAIAAVQLVREHIVARIVALCGQPEPPPLQ